MNRGAIQKGFLAVLAWLVLYFLTSDAIYQKMWSPEQKMAAFSGENETPDAPPLSRNAKVLIYALPTAVIGGAIFLYWRAARRQRMTSTKS